MAAGKDRLGAPDVLVAVGGGSVIGGAYAFHPALGLVAIGLALIAFGLLVAYRHG